jgi:predicted nuclease with TOPRIM domain
MKGGIVAISLMALAAFQDYMTYSAVAAFAIVLSLYIRLKMQDPYEQIKRLKGEVQKMVEALAAEKVRVMDLTNRNDEIKTTLNTLHADHMELKGQFSQLNVAYGRLGEQFNKVMDELKKERELRDIQYAELVRNQAKHGDL